MNDHELLLAIQQELDGVEWTHQAKEQAVTFTARPQLNVNWDDLRRKISAEWHETLDFLAE